MHIFKPLSLFSALILLLSGCGSSPTSQVSFDASSDIANIEDAVAVFQGLTASAQQDPSAENALRISKLNPSALDGIENATNDLKTHLNENWEAIGPGSSVGGISRELLMEWADAYLYWLNYQRKIQSVAESCAVEANTFLNCVGQNAAQTLEWERASTGPLVAVQAKIQERQ